MNRHPLTAMEAVLRRERLEVEKLVNTEQHRQAQLHAFLSYALSDPRALAAARKLAQELTDLSATDALKYNETNGLWQPPDFLTPDDLFGQDSYRYALRAMPPIPFFTYALSEPEVTAPPSAEPEWEVNLVEALTGWKAWEVNAQGLWSVQQAEHLWPPDQPFVARCDLIRQTIRYVSGENGLPVRLLVDVPPCAAAVSLDHTCGIYAGTRKEAESYRDDDNGENDQVLGEVYGWGRYVRGEYGWRAQFAYPKNFYLKADQGNLIDWLRPYHVPIYVEQPVLIYNPEEDGYEHGDHEADGYLRTAEDAAAGDEDGAGDEADS